MKLQTSIKPRRDGTVILTGQNGKNYVFAAGEDGELACDVDDKPTVAMALAGGFFYPADTQDLDAATELVAQIDGADDEGDDEDGDDEGSMDALPIESNTPPAPVRKKPGPKPRNPAY